MFNWDSRDDEKITISSLTGTSSWAFTDNAVFNWIASVITRMVRFAVMKYILWGVGIVIISFIFGNLDFKSIVKLSDEVSTKLANDDVKGGMKIFLKKSPKKIQIANIHPVYNSTDVEEWETETGRDFKKLFSFITIKVDGKKEDLLVLTKAASDGENDYKLEQSTIFGLSANNVCEDMLGAEIPTEIQKSFYDKKSHPTIEYIKEELTQENDEGIKRFRCVIDAERIKDLLDEQTRRIISIY